MLFYACTHNIEYYRLTTLKLTILYMTVYLSSLLYCVCVCVCNTIVTYKLCCVCTYVCMYIYRSQMTPELWHHKIPPTSTKELLVIHPGSVFGQPHKDRGRHYAIHPEWPTA